MMRFVGIFILALLTLSCRDANSVGVRQGQHAPEIQGREVSGKTIHLSDFKGKVVLLDFWATWCVPCRIAIPHEKRMQNTYGDKSFVILGVSQDHQIEALQAFLEATPLPWVNLFDEGRAIASEWGVESIPSFVLIDKKGVIRGRWEGAQATAEIEAKIADLLREGD